MTRWFTSLAIAGALGVLPCSVRSQDMGAGSKENLDLPFDSVGTSEDEEDAPEIVIFYGQQFEGDGIFFCCDHSSSMTGPKLSRLKQEVTKNLTQFNEKTQFGIVFFDINMVCFPSSGRPTDASPSMKAAGISFTMSLQAGMGTCGKAALLKVLNMANQSSAKRKVILFLSDGEMSCDGQGANYPQSTLAETTAHNTQRVKINTICLGPADMGAAGPKFMQDLARQNNGQYSRVID